MVTFNIPTLWKGGQIHESWKRKGSICDAKSFRDVLLSAMGCKCFAKFLRAQNKSTLENAASSTMFGSGIRGASTEHAHLMCRSVHAMALAQRQCLGLVFVGVLGAFASMVRSVALPGLNASEDLVPFFN